MTVWDKLFIHANLATLEGDDLGIVTDAALAVDKHVIAWIGKQKKLPHRNAKEIIDVKGRWILPGLIDCHTHLVYAGNRAQEFEARLQGQSYVEIAAKGKGINYTVQQTRAASLESLYTASKKRLLTMIKQGVTMVEIKSGYGLDLATEIKILKTARALGQNLPVTVKTSYLGAHTTPLEYYQNSDGYIEFICTQVLPQIAALNLADYVDGFCEKMAFSPAQIECVFQKAMELDIPIKLHAEQLSNSGGSNLAAAYHAVSVDHLEYANEQNIQALKQSGTIAVLLPGAFYYLQEQQKPPIHLLRQYNIPMAIATDCNPGTAPVTSLLLMLNMACVLFGLSPIEALRGITINGAKALQVDMTYGSLAVGKKADLTLWDIEHPIDLVYTIGENPLYASYKSGIIL